jgi:DNA polymerase III subunit alpha
VHPILAARSNFSIGESVLTVEKLVDDAKAAGAFAVALVDTMTVTGLVDFTNRAKKAEIKPIIGCRLRLVDNPTWRREKGQKEKQPPEYFVTAYVLSEKGLQAIYRLLTLAYSEERFYYSAKLGFDDLYAELAKVTGDDLVIATGDVYSVLHHPQAETIVDKLHDHLGPNLFLTISPINSPLFDTLNKKAIELAQRLDIPLLATRPVFYSKEKDMAHEIMGAITQNVTIDEIWHRTMHNRDLHAMDTIEFGHELIALQSRLARLRGLDSHEVGVAISGAVNSTQRLVNMVTYEWSKQKPSLPVMAPNEFAQVVEECKKGWVERFSASVFGHKPSAKELTDVYKPRLTYELEVLKKLDFSGYFLLVQDVVRFAKSSGILVGPGRGSVGGSLVAYLMGITDCDPLRFNLLFERFINPDRIDLPDADLDFMSNRRQEVVKFLIDKYGQEHVAGVANFMALGTASSIRDVSRVCGLEESAYRCSKFAPKAHGAIIKLEPSAEKVPEIGEFRDKNPEIWELCLDLEGIMRNLGQHAAGIVVSGCKLTERSFVDRRKGGEGVVNWDKRIVEEQGLIKMDILGLTTLDLIDLILNYIKERHGKKLNLSRIPLDDPEVLDLFAKGKTTGVFQFESGGMRRLLKELGKDGDISFEDITASTALYRPGPMESGMMDSYWKRKQGIESVSYDHPLMEPILSPTFGVIVYQEQVMQISRALAGYSAPDADKLRKIMGKKLPAEMEKERGKFTSGIVKTIGETEEWAKKLFDMIAGFAGYGFNRSHSVEYSLISYQSAYLKVKYPVEFYAAALSLMDDDKLPALISEAHSQGIQINPPDVNLSTERFEILTDSLLSIPFSRVKGLSERAAKSIVETRGAVPFKSKEDFEDRVDKRLINIAKRETLEKIGAFARITPGAPPARDPSRIKDQREFIPGLINDIVPINRDMQMDRISIRQLVKNIDDYKTTLASDGAQVRPSFSTKSKIMVIFDAPSGGRNSEETAGVMGRGSAFAWEATVRSINEVGFSINDLYITALLKRPKSGKSIDPDEIRLYEPYLKEEIQLLKPPTIVALGSNITRWFFPDLKGKASDQAGKVVYHKGFDANVIIGFSPGEIWHDPDKQSKLDEVFAAAMSLTSI